MTDTRARMCMSCLRTGHHAWDCADREPVHRVPGPAATSVMEAPQIAVAPRNRAGRIPAWSVVSIASGAVLVALGWILNEPVSQLVFEAIPR